MRLIDADAAETVDIVLCSECRHARKSENAFHFDGETPLCECPYMWEAHLWHEFCSWGERRAD